MPGFIFQYLIESRRMIDCFRQLNIACDLKKPLFLHERDAHSEMVDLLERYKDKLPTCVIHCFTGTKEHAIKYLSMGCYIGLTGENTPFMSASGTQCFSQLNLLTHLFDFPAA